MIEYPETVDFSKLAPCILFYSATNAGKTMAGLTCEDPILFINTEGKDPRIIHNQVKHNKQIHYVKFENFDDQQDNLNRLYENAIKGTFPFKTIFYDGLTFGQQNFRHELEDARGIVRREEEKSRGLVDQFRFEKPDWGSIGSIMARITKLLCSFSNFGVTVICTALEDPSYPKWGRGVRIGPALVGQDFPKLLAGYFHFIGYIIKPFQMDRDGKIDLPIISFAADYDPDNQDYIARCSSNELFKKGPAPLNFEKIIKVIRGIK